MHKTVVITGASRGIGAQTARVFADAGYNVVIGYLSHAAEAQALLEELHRDGVRALAVRVDVACRDQVAELMDEAVREFGQIDVLVNNAGIAMQSLMTDVTEQEWQRMLAVNLSGVFYGCQCALPHMVHRKQGKIINLSSIWGLVGASCEVAYSASKAGIIGLTKALAKEVGPSGIQVNCIAPGVIDTAMNAALTPAVLSELQEETPLGKLGTPDDIARAILFLASPDADFITGQVLSPNGGFVI